MLFGEYMDLLSAYSHITEVDVVAVAAAATANIRVYLADCLRCVVDDLIFRKLQFFFS